MTDSVTGSAQFTDCSSLDHFVPAHYQLAPHSDSDYMAKSNIVTVITYHKKTLERNLALARGLRLPSVFVISMVFPSFTTRCTERRFNCDVNVPM